MVDRKRKKMYEAQERYTRKNRATGKTRVNVWVPEDCAEELKEIAKEMRQGTWFEE